VIFIALFVFHIRLSLSVLSFSVSGSRYSFPVPGSGFVSFSCMSLFPLSITFQFFVFVIFSASLCPFRFHPRSRLPFPYIRSSFIVSVSVFNSVFIVVSCFRYHFPGSGSSCHFRCAFLVYSSPFPFHSRYRSRSRFCFRFRSHASFFVSFSFPFPWFLYCYIPCSSFQFVVSLSCFPFSFPFPLMA
jgi:hypothetical protein